MKALFYDNSLMKMQHLPKKERLLGENTIFGLKSQYCNYKLNKDYLIMQKVSCIGCRTSFQQSEELELQNLTIQFENYQIPLKEDSAKWNLLRAILSFLNSKGGTIYIGVQNKKGAVKGLFLQRKDRDSFKLTIKQLLEKIYPKVDLNNRQEVEIQYVPVFKANYFEGKFVVKIIVQQGDPSQVYCISERIKLDGGPNNKIDDFQVFYAYQRHNLGGAEQIKGVKLMNLIHERALKPNKVSSIFHEGCNPPQPYLQVQIRTLIFSSISQQQHKILETVYKSYFQSENIDYEDKHTKQKMTTEIYIEDEEEFKIVKTFIMDKVAFLNEIFNQAGCQAHFQIKGEVQHYFSIANNHSKRNGKVQKPNKEKANDKSGKKQQPKKETKFPYKQKSERINDQKILQNRTPGFRIEEKKELPKTIQNRRQEQYVITFTHIEPRSIQTLEKFLRQGIYRAYNKKFSSYVNTIQMSLQSQKERQNYLVELLHKQNQLSSYGFKQEIRYGISTKQLKICNVNWQKGGELKGYLKESMIDELEGFRHQKNALVCQMKTRESACEWLDKLLIERKFKQTFSLKGAAQNRVAKIKVYLVVEKVVKVEN